MTIDASIPLQGVMFNAMDNMMKGARLRQMNEEMRNAREDRQRANEGRARLSDLLIAQDRMRSAGSYAPGGATLPTGNPAEVGPPQQRRLGDLMPGAGGPQGPTLGGAMADVHTPGIGDGIPGNQQAGGDVEQMRKEAMQRGYEAAWQALVQADPEGALKVRKSGFDNLKGEVEMIGTLTAGVQDQSTYDMALQRANSFGLDTSNLPREYSPELVQGLMMQAAGAGNALTQMRQDRRLQWDMDDDVADNDRADRALDARINYQNERLEDFDEAEEGRRDRANKPRASAAPKVPQSEGALYADIRRRFNKGEPITDRERAFGKEYEARQRAKSQGRGSKGSGYSGGAKSDLFGPVYKKGNIRIQMSKSKGGYVDVATGQLVK